jgi:hypothetical protein
MAINLIKKINRKYVIIATNFYLKIKVIFIFKEKIMPKNYIDKYTS